uniref:Serine/threonine-protein phosphatase 7 long form-like n=1 Tax=Vitis vinifera TaxID=29760 RepID=A5C6F7_VITVI|nr:hypothetical protein VITISV_026014 [Vitis vinifera]
MDEAINYVVSDWTPWKNPNLGNVDGELSIGQIFSSKLDFQLAMKMFSIKSHQEFTVYRLNASVLVLKCKKAPECQWRLRAMTVKDTELPRFFLALEQSNPGCLLYSKMIPRNNPNEEIFQHVFWAFTPSIQGFTHYRPILSIDGTHLYGKYKGTLLIAMGCDADVNETYSRWTELDAYHRFCMRHLASNFNTKFKDKTLKDLMCRAAMESKALSHDGGRRYGIMTTNMFEVFNGVLKGAHNLPITALVQLTFYRVNSYFTIRREHGANRLASGEEFTPHIDIRIKAKVVKAGSHEVLLYDHVAGRFHVKTKHSIGSSNRKPRTYHHRHRSSTIRVDPDMGSVLTCRHRFRREWVLGDRVQPYIIQSGLYVFHRMGHVKVDWPLITALLERWCPKTHTFHMPVGEMTITLQDVVILFGLRVHGHPVTGSIDIDWHALCEELLGVRSTETDIRGASLTICFITTHFSHLPPRVVDEVTLQRRARAYLLLLVGGSLFLDKKGVYIQLAILPMLTDFDETAQYSWGSATLAHLYRELCQASLNSVETITGPLQLLQLWSWERLHVGRPSILLVPSWCIPC